MASLIGFGAYVPDRLLTNGELAGRLNCTPEWIFQASGIETRHIADESQSVVDLAVLASRDCVSHTRVEPSEIGLIIVSTGSGSRRFPGPAASVGKELGIPGVPCLDLPVASAGSLFGLSLASRLTEAYGPILVVAAEKMSTVAQQEPLDKNIAILFGDGAGACLVTQDSGPLRIHDSLMRSDGSFAEDLRLDVDGRLTMNGLTVIMQAARKIPTVIQELLKKQGTAAADVAVFLMHQANQNLIDRVAKALGVPTSRFYSNIARLGNTSSASMLIAAAEYFNQHKLAQVRNDELKDRSLAVAAQKATENMMSVSEPRPQGRVGEKVVFAAFGAGFHWGAVLAERTA